MRSGRVVAISRGRGAIGLVFNTVFVGRARWLLPAEIALQARIKGAVGAAAVVGKVHHPAVMRGVRTEPAIVLRYARIVGQVRTVPADMIYMRPWGHLAVIGEAGAVPWSDSLAMGRWWGRGIVGTVERGSVALVKL